MNDTDRLTRQAKQFDTAGKLALLIGIVALPFTSGKGDSLIYGFFLFLILKAISERYRKKAEVPKVRKAISIGTVRGTWRSINGDRLSSGLSPFTFYLLAACYSSERRDGLLRLRASSAHRPLRYKLE